MRLRFAITVLLMAGNLAHAGLHLSIETFNELPAKWKGYLPDLRRLRGLAVPTLDGSRSASLLHNTYADALLKLESATRERELTADELADLGALQLRLGKAEKAVTTLRDARRKHPEHFRIAANLGTAWQIVGDLAAAQEALEDAVRLAPAKWKAAEALHLKLVQSRRREKTADLPDGLFAKSAPENLALLQRLALWLPTDGRVLWGLGELARERGDIRTAANILDGCVTEFAMKSPTLRERRRNYRAEADALEAKNEHGKAEETGFKTGRAFARLFDEKTLPKIKPDGVNDLPWIALGETTVARPFKPQYLDYVSKLDGKRVALVGNMRPLGGEKNGEIESFLLTEYAVGCWFCDIPDATGLAYVDLKTPAEVSRNAVKVEGVLKLNRDDPENYLFKIVDAVVKVAD